MGDRVRLTRGQHFISVCNQTPKSTQPSTVRGTYQSKGGDALWLESKGRYGLFAGKTVLPYLSALENALVIWYLKALYKCPGLLYFLGRIVVLRTQMRPIVTDRVA